MNRVNADAGSGRNRSAAGFTLIEMILAIGIIVGLLIVAMLFYRQAADLRRQILLESERCSTIRLLLDRMTADLRSAVAGAGSGREFLGDTGSLSFVRGALGSAVSVPGRPMRMPASGGRMRVTYATVASMSGTNVSVRGFDWREDPLEARRVAPVRPAAATNLSYIALGAGLDPTNSVTAPEPEPVTELVRYAHFRYWDGAGWRDGWTNSSPPAGVEIVLGADPLPEDANAGEYPYEQFRRVVFLPAGIVLQQPDEPAEETLSPP